MWRWVVVGTSQPAIILERIDCIYNGRIYYSLLLEIIATSFLVIVVAQKALVGPGTFLQEDGRLIRSRILKMNIQRDTRQNLTILYSLDTFNRLDNSR